MKLLLKALVNTKFCHNFSSNKMSQLDIKSLYLFKIIAREKRKRSTNMLH